MNASRCHQTLAAVGGMSTPFKTVVILTLRWEAMGIDPVRNTAFLSHLYIRMNILPRQARDKHRENSKKMPFFAGRRGYANAMNAMRILAAKS
eukprot:COSAG06_NODE_4784_length_3957_cov_4.801970_5_plen_93_part_00